jgi:hypothetical protein
LPETASIDIRGALAGHQFVADWLRYTETFEYPESFAVFALLVMASCAVDRRVLINPGAKPEMFTNLYAILYGPSGARKGEALMDALRLLGEALPDAPVYPMNFTMEALRGRMHKESEDFGATSGLILSEELSTLLGGREYLLNNSLFLGKIWDCRPSETFLTIAHAEQVIKHPYPTMGACSTPEAFGDLDPKALAAGFLRRMIMVQEYAPKGDSALPQANTAFFQTVLVPRFKDRFSTTAIDRAGVLMRLSDDAMKLNEEWYHTELHEMRQTYIAPRENRFVNTVQVHAFKIAALLHLLDGGDPKELSAQALGWGFAAARALLPGTFEAYNALVPSFFARVCMVMRRIVGAGAILEGALDAKVKAEIGSTPDQTTAARLSLYADGIMAKGKDGKVRIH